MDKAEVVERKHYKNKKMQSAKIGNLNQSRLAISSPLLKLCGRFKLNSKSMNNGTENSPVWSESSLS